MTTRIIETEDGPLEVKEIDAHDIRTFRRYAGGLRDLIARIRQYSPEANIYLGCDTLHLMIGPPHTGSDGYAHQEHSVEEKFIPGIDGGDW